MEIRKEEKKTPQWPLKECIRILNVVGIHTLSQAVLSPSRPTGDFRGGLLFFLKNKNP